MFSRATLLGCTALISFAMFVLPAAAAPFTVATGATNTTAQTLGSGSGQTGAVASGGTLQVSGSNVAVTITGNSATVDNQGTIKQTGTGRVIRDNTGVTGLIVNNGSSANSSALMQAADADVIQMNKANGNITLNNYGTMTSLNASKGGAQAVDFNAVTTGTNIINNFATGKILAKDADAVRPGVNGAVNNYGLIESTITTDTGSDGIDLQQDSGITVNNKSTGTVSGARHGITGGRDSAAPTVPFTVTINNDAGGLIKGNNGAGVNVDGFGASQTATVVNNGTITGNGVTGDGDGVDIDGLANITNTGTIRSLNAVDSAGTAYSEGISVGGGSITNSGTIRGSVAAGNTGAVGRGITLAGNDRADGTRDGLYANQTVTNQAGGLIQGDSDSGIIASGVASGFTLAINNNAGATIRGGGTVNAAVKTSADNDTLTNAGTIDGSSGGKAIDLGAGNDTLNILTGSSILGGVEGGLGTDTINLDGTGALGGTSGFENLNVQGGTWTLTGTQNYTTGALTNGGILKTDPTTVTFTTLNIDATSALQAGAGDEYRIGGNMLVRSIQNAVWDTVDAILSFFGGGAHTMLLTGDDKGASTTGLVDNFAWQALNLDAGSLTLGRGKDNGALAFYVGELTGLNIQSGIVQNIIGNGFNVYYDALLNQNLRGVTYALVGGGYLMAYNNEAQVPAPGAFALLATGLAFAGWRRRKAQR